MLDSLQRSCVLFYAYLPQMKRKLLNIYSAVVFSTYTEACCPRSTRMTLEIRKCTWVVPATIIRSGYVDKRRRSVELLDRCVRRICSLPMWTDMVTAIEDWSFIEISVTTSNSSINSSMMSNTFRDFVGSIQWQ